MATITISGLPEVSTILDYTVIPVETVGITQRITGANLKAYLAALPSITATSGNISGQLSVGSFVSNGAATINGALQVTGVTAVTGSFTNLTTSNLAVTGTTTLSGNVSVTNITASQNVHGATLSGTITTPAQPNITSVGTLGNLTVTGTISGNINGSAATVTSGAQPNITSVGTLTGLTVNGNATIANLSVTTVSVATLSPTTLNATTVNATNYTMSNSFLPTSNGTLNLGGPSNYFATVYGQATSARYADLAECYEADANYEPGTVLSFGDVTEVTLSKVAADEKIAGVVSTKPAYLMNDGLDATFVAKVALQGRVPCKVHGPVRRGDMLVSSGIIPGAAVASASPRAGTVIGKAVESHTGDDVGLIEVVVGRL